MAPHGYKFLIFIGIMLMIGKASSYYNKSYNEYTFILPNIVSDQSNTRPLELSFSGAQEWCPRNIDGSTLATIGNKHIQRNIALFIQSALQKKEFVRSRYNNFIVNGKYHDTDSWHWVNGHLTNTGITVHERHGNSIYSFYAHLDGKNFNIYSDKPNMARYVICEYPGKSESCGLFLNGRCYQTKDKASKWYDARNQCLDGGGEMASFETLTDANINVTLKNLSLHFHYWIGLQKNEWRWQDTGFAIKYTNWEDYRPSNYSGQCLCLTHYQWKWTECDCSAEYPFICILNGWLAKDSLL